MTNMNIKNCSFYTSQYQHSYVVTSTNISNYSYVPQKQSQAESFGQVAMQAIKTGIKLDDCGDPDLRTVLDAIENNDEEKIAIMGGEWAVRLILGKLLMKNIKAKDTVNA